MKKDISIDALALEMLVDGREKDLQIVGERTRAYLEGQVPCPECGNTGPHDGQPWDLDPRHANEFLCEACGELFVADFTEFLKTGEASMSKA